MIIAIAISTNISIKKQHIDIIINKQEVEIYNIKNQA
jgi:hypothetical protein